VCTEKSGMSLVKNTVTLAGLKTALHLPLIPENECTELLNILFFFSGIYCRVVHSRYFLLNTFITLLWKMWPQCRQSLNNLILKHVENSGYIILKYIHQFITFFVIVHLVGGWAHRLLTFVLALRFVNYCCYGNISFQHTINKINTAENKIMQAFNFRILQFAYSSDLRQCYYSQPVLRKVLSGWQHA